jgi:iron-sulfur cluster assembly protein
LRVFIAGGGCSGFQYGMAFENQMEDGDTVFESKGVRLYVDQASAMYLEGAQVDYVDSLMGGGFRIENPNAVSTCSCGQSFNAGAGDGAEAGHSHAHAHGGGCGCGHH